MVYIISDIHGCYHEFLKLLEKIRFTDRDILYILGDVVDRGPEPIRLLQDLMGRSNVYPILGNHDYMALVVLSRFYGASAEGKPTSEDLINYVNWSRNGGAVTAGQFRGLSAKEQQAVLDYLGRFSLYGEIRAGKRRYVLVHGDIRGFSEERELGSYDCEDLIFYRADYGRRYYKDENTFLVTGHTPTIVIREDGLPLVYRQHGHIAIDCGCVYGGKLAAYCLNTDTVYYEDGPGRAGS